jgi:PIN domain nuclease of toxin-antitoxin system
MAAVAVDTHTILWYLTSDPRLSSRAVGALDQATSEGELIHVPSVCIVEITYLIEKGKLPVYARESLMMALDDPTTPCQLAPLDRGVAATLQLVSRAEVPDLPDRIISATALSLGVPLVTRDGKIRASQVPTIWQERPWSCATAHIHLASG